MAYTVKKLAKLSGVSARTLHHYDAIGLLKPAFYGLNNYRYYEEPQLLLLQQILFYRELGFSLNDIQAILARDDFDKVKALQSHKKVLEQNINHVKTLIETIDKTIAHIEGDVKMKDEELYYGFDPEKQKEHEKYLVEKGIVTQAFLDECNQKVKNWSDKEKNAFVQDIERIMGALVDALDEGVKPSDPSVQSLMREHYEWICRTWTPNKERYLELVDLYQTKDFRTFYDKRHPALLAFMVEAMKAFSLKL